MSDRLSAGEADRWLRPAADLHLFMVEDGSVLFDRAGQQLFYLNAAATCIWCHVEERLSLPSIIERVAGTMRLDRTAARRHVMEMIAMWRRLGLLHGRGERRQPPRLPQEPAEAPREESAPASLQAITKWVRYRLLHTNFSLGFSDPLLEDLVHPVLAHLERVHASPAAVQLGIVLENGAAQVWQGGVLLGSCPTLRSLAPLVLGLTSTLALRQYRHLLALHAAGIGAGEAAMLIAAPSGSGKTTLAAVLHAAGWDYLSDDIVLLRRESLEAVGVPNSLGIKRGGWELIASHFPGRQPAMHLRPDGKLIRYLSPVRPRAGFAHPRPVRWVVVLRRSAASPGRLRPLGRLEGLQRLMQNCCGIPGDLAPGDAERLVRWSGTVAWHELEMGDLDTAVARLQSLLAEPKPLPSPAAQA